jgi:hypothetical protein
MALVEEDALRPEYESSGVDGEGQPIEIGDDVADELGEEVKSIVFIVAQKLAECPRNRVCNPK